MHARVRPRLRLLLPALLAPALLATACARAADHVVASVVSAPVSDVKARAGADAMAGDPQTLMTRLTSPTATDSARAARLVPRVRAAILPYVDTSAALRAGYRPFPAAPPPEMRIVHYVHGARSRREKRGIDPAKPGALLFERMADGRLHLVGAMFTAPVGASLAELDRRVPLSMTQWHLHQNVCVPRPVWDAAQWARRDTHGRALFGPGSPVNTPGACEHVGGRFLPTVFGWMVHVYPLAPDSTQLWNAMYGHGMGGEHHH